MKTPAQGQGIIVLLLLASMSAVGCAQTSPSASSASGRIHFVVIEDGVSDNDVQARAGEEVRWVNVRTAPVSVIFNELQHGDVSCEHGFSNSTNAHMAAVILPDHNASLCFSAVGRRTYRVLDAHRPSVELNREAAVEVVEAR
jgi:hypothetical protein